MPTGEPPVPPPATGSVQVVGQVQNPGVGGGGPVVARPSPASVSGAVSPSCKVCHKPKNTHELVWICQDGTAVRPDGTIHEAVTARPVTLITAKYKAVLDSARAAGTQFKDLPKPEDHGCLNTKIIKEIDGSVYAIPADAIGVGLDIGEAVKNTVSRFGMKRIGLAVFVLALLCGNVWQFALSPVDAVPTTAQPNSTAAPAPIAGSDDAYRALCVEAYNGGDMTVAQERAFLGLEGVDVQD